MPLSWNEIRTRAFRFVNEWKDTHREEADAKPFLQDFLDVFGISRKRVATFEHKVKKLDDHSGYIDMLWRGQLLVEMKSRGQDLEKAYKQAKDYCHGLKDYELPSLILICDFHAFHLYDVAGKRHVFQLDELPKHLQLFSGIAGYTQSEFKEQDPVNIKAAELMGTVHDQLKANGYDGHELEVYLVRLLFILFADDSAIFERGIFQQYLLDRTAEDGSDLAMHLAQLFEVLNTPDDRRQKNLDEQLRRFPYVNGKLFSERLSLAAFDSAMRKQLIGCCTLDWASISPAIFGSLFQSVMDANARRNLGAHYTSEGNIRKVIGPLFMDDLAKEFAAAGDNKAKLQKLHEKISKLRFLDPACGCGNFLVVAYRELRQLELEIVK
ncbi:MAG: class I SAM-dependent DNA methyltransferase, partial [Verrucomicrobiaceae bacterium]